MAYVGLIRFLLVLPLLGGALALHAGKKESWMEVRSPHFVAYSDDGESEARKALMAFEGLRSVFGVIFPGIRLDPPKPMLLIVTRSQDSMARFLPEAFEGKDPKRPAGVFLMRADRNYAILRADVSGQVDQPYFALFHEYTHSIVHQNFPSLPTWLDEGIADYYGATEIRSDKVYLGRIPRGRLQELRDRARLPIETLLTVTQESPHYREGEKAGIFYAQSWAFVHYLFMDEEARKAGLFQAYLKALGRERDPLAAARVGFGDLGKLQGTLGMYSHQILYHFWVLPLAVELTDKDFQTRVLEDAEALVVRAEFLQYTQHEKESYPLLDQALSLAPKAPGVHAALGYRHFLQGENEAASLHFGESIRLGSQDFRPPYYLAKLALGGPLGSEDRARIIGWLETAQRLRPDFPGTHLALSRLYLTEPRDPVRAIQEGKAAVGLEPQNLAHRADLGVAFINLDMETQAKAMGEQLVELARTPQEKQIAASYGALLAQYLEQKFKPAAQISPPAPDPAPLIPTTPPSQGQTIKFSLPSYYAPLGREVLQLVREGKLEVAIGRVEKALAAATNDYDGKALRTLLKDLRGRLKPK
jgi:tetratricopeptide (TPR) repeat protein